MIYNFRIDRDNRELLMGRIKENRQICQGWGGGTEINLDVRNENFVMETKNFHELKSTRIPTNLTYIRNFKNDDLLIVPHLPENGLFMIFVVNGSFPDCYHYQKNDDSYLNHRISFKKSYGLNGNLDIHNVAVYEWYSQLPWMRLPVFDNSRYQYAFNEIMAVLDDDPDASFAASLFREFLENVKEDVIKNLLAKLGTMSPSKGEISFERLCEDLFIKFGYKVIDRNIFDGKGSDTDLLLNYQSTENDTNPFINEDKRVHVQIKRHSGTTDAEAVNQILAEIEKEPLKEGIVITLAEDFTAKAKELAEDNGILLINGKRLCEILLAKL